MEHTYRLVISCPDKVGIVARVGQFVAELGGWLTEANYHSDADTDWFFMRNEIRASSLSISLDEFVTQFKGLAEEYSMDWTIRDSQVKKRVVIMASKASHCLADLLHRWHSGELNCEISAVISNHKDLGEMAQWYQVPFHHVAVPKDDKQEANLHIQALIEKYRADLVVLARYMQIIPPKVCHIYAGRMINIHHSFLPSFVGANPYLQAFQRGVKLIGATSHYVTEQLDEGPIIEQDVARVSHRHNKDDMLRIGKDIETRVLASAVRNHLEDRVIVHGNKTVVFD